MSSNQSSKNFINVSAQKKGDSVGVCNLEQFLKVHEDTKGGGEMQVRGSVFP